MVVAGDHLSKRLNTRKVSIDLIVRRRKLDMLRITANAAFVGEN